VLAAPLADAADASTVSEAAATKAIPARIAVGRRSETVTKSGYREARANS
jgi:hypothetical protein